MINLQDVSVTRFLKDYWQKKPLIIRQAIPGFINHLSPDELAGLSLEDDIESRIVLESPGMQPAWHLKRGPFKASDFNELPSTHWTLLVQGVDRLVPEVYKLLEHFNFIPQWRIDDVMISYAALHGSVGPHYDHYDVFLYQAKGRREWSLTTQNCTTDNHIQDLELRIMREFATEERIILEEGDMLYLPPHVGHYGISLSEECMTYSFGYRSYQGQELLDSLGDYLSERGAFKKLYQDPDWSGLKNTSEIPLNALTNAQILLKQLIHDEELMKSWFACFATQLDQQAEQQLPAPLEEDEFSDLSFFIEELNQGVSLIRDPSCRFAYYAINQQYQLFINGCEWPIDGVSPDLLCHIANNRFIHKQFLKSCQLNTADQLFLFDLWRLQWLQAE